jgi:hypothetical protein
MLQIGKSLYELFYIKHKGGFVICLLEFRQFVLAGQLELGFEFLGYFF